MNVRRELELLLAAKFGVNQEDIYDGVPLYDLGFCLSDIPKLSDEIVKELDINVPDGELTEELTFQELVNTVDKYA